MIKVVLIGITLYKFAAAVDCPKKTNVQQFSVSKYMGLWYEAYFFGPDNFNEDNKCPKEDFNQEPNNITIIDSSELLREPGKQNVWAGYVTLAETGQLVIHQDFGSGNIVVYTLDILGTDYDNWAVAWSCPGFNNKQNSWIMTRKRLNYGEHLPTKQRIQISKVLRNAGIKWSQYTRTPNFNCTF